MSGRKLMHGSRYTSRREYYDFVPAPHGIALLFSCRKACLEIGKVWLTQVTFCFEGPGAMVRKFTNLSQETRSTIRHVRIVGHEPRSDIDPIGTIHEFWQFFRLLENMKLDTLEILGPILPCTPYEDCELFTKYSRGWKQLHYVTNAATFIRINRPERLELLREEQPAGWQLALNKRDGSGSGVSVTMHKSADPHNPLAVLCAAMRTDFSYYPLLDQDVDWFDEAKTAQILGFHEGDGGILIVVKQGSLPDYQAMRDSSDYQGMDDCLEYWLKMTQGMWYMMAKLKDIHTRFGEDSKFAGLSYLEVSETVVDKYKHVDDYAFLPFRGRQELQ